MEDKRAGVKIRQNTFRWFPTCHVFLLDVITDVSVLGELSRCAKHSWVNSRCMHVAFKRAFTEPPQFRKKNHNRAHDRR